MGLAHAAFIGSGGHGVILSANNVSVTGSGYIACGFPGVTPTPNLTVSGGSGNYSFLWQRVSGTPTYGPWSCSSTTAQNPTWRSLQPVCAPTASPTEVWQVTAIDESNGKNGVLVINVTIIWQNLA